MQQVDDVEYNLCYKRLHIFRVVTDKSQSRHQKLGYFFHLPQVFPSPVIYTLPKSKAEIHSEVMKSSSLQLLVDMMNATSFDIFDCIRRSHPIHMMCTIRECLSVQETHARECISSCNLYSFCTLEIGEQRSLSINQLIQYPRPS